MVFKNGNDSCEFDIHLVYWENIMENDILKGYVIPTLDYNEAKKITNLKITIEKGDKREHQGTQRSQPDWWLHH